MLGVPGALIRRLGESGTELEDEEAEETAGVMRRGGRDGPGSISMSLESSPPFSSDIGEAARTRFRFRGLSGGDGVPLLRRLSSFFNNCKTNGLGIGRTAVSQDSGYQQSA